MNAIQKTTYLLDGLRQLEEEWRTRADSTHVDLAPTDCVPTTIAGGDWIVTHPGACVTTLHIAYVPGMADADGWGSRVEAEVEAHVAALAAADPWLAEHPPRVEWTYDVPPAEIDPAIPCAPQRSAPWRTSAGRAAPPARTSGTTARRSRGSAGMPVVCLGPGAVQSAHTVDEHVEVADLVRCAQALAVTAMRFCGTA